MLGNYITLDFTLEVPVFVLKFVPTMYDESALQVLIGYFSKPANRIARRSIIVNTGNELRL